MILPQSSYGKTIVVDLPEFVEEDVDILKHTSQVREERGSRRKSLEKQVTRVSRSQKLRSQTRRESEFRNAASVDSVDLRLLEC